MNASGGLLRLRYAAVVENPVNLSCRERRGHGHRHTAAASTARSAMHHSGRLSAITATGSPAPRPNAHKPRRTSRICSKSSLPDISTTPSLRHWRRTGRYGNRSAIWNGRSASVLTGRFITSFTRFDAQNQRQLSKQEDAGLKCDGLSAEGAASSAGKRRFQAL